ncbi:hypothetical protein K432DRAFT_410949 [Lepidopterella palustris CBS 459.81]|uniref:Uncharacterized protein n=1 Tax=Lepidopterella palustris CBS 459.81 TaxID=1314670 RepID=A0A8E2J8W4_9PEZI|nr:hypothetical protein K432DRAFT_410949 [Lepidopterella palustris CBS 459.81]
MALIALVVSIIIIIILSIIVRVVARTVIKAIIAVILFITGTIVVILFFSQIMDRIVEDLIMTISANFILRWFNVAESSRILYVVRQLQVKVEHRVVRRRGLTGSG